MHTRSFRALILAALSVVALIGAGVGMPAGTAPARAGVPDAFGGPLEAQAVVRPIARDLTSVSRGALQRVPCADALPAHACFAVRR